MFKIKRTLVAVFAFTAACLGESPAGDPIAKSELSADTFEKLHKELQPDRDELWRSIPWHASILEGREQAAKEKKPIFVWVASGEPLACG
jgi:hypothetical protein